MTNENVMKIYQDTAFPHVGGSDKELQVANYLIDRCADLGLEARLEPFPVPMADIRKAELWVDGVSIPCKGFLCAGSGEVEASLYYLAVQDDPHALRQCKGKIVLVDSHLRHWMYHDMLDNGALGYITFDGNINTPDRDIDQRELREVVAKGRKAIGVNINAKDAQALIRGGASMAKIILEQDEYMGESNNVVAEIPGEIDETIVFSAHYDTTSNALGSYDNMSGCIGLLCLAEHFRKNRPHRSLRFVWCGSEERGLLGSKAYVAAHKDELEQFVLNINIDMLGCATGYFVGAASAEEALVHYMRYLAMERGKVAKIRHGINSSDSTPFADAGVPACTFGHAAAPGTYGNHDRYDTPEIVSAENTLDDAAYIIEFAERLSNAIFFPVSRTIPQKIKDELDVYLLRKRP